MAWTTPRTWTDGELVTKAIMDPHIRDNFNAMGPHFIARKTSDQSVTSSTAFVDCTSMVLPVLANEVWEFGFNMLYSAGTTGDMKTQFTQPTAGRIDAHAIWSNASASIVIMEWSGTTSPTTSSILLGNGLGGSRYFVPIRGIYVGGANAGNVTLQFAQQVSDGTAATIHANSTVWAVKLA